MELTLLISEIKISVNSGDNLTQQKNIEGSFRRKLPAAKLLTTKIPTEKFTAAKLPRTLVCFNIFDIFNSHM